MVNATTDTAWAAIPYCGRAPDPGELWGRWNFDPVVLAVLVIAGGALLMRSSARVQAAAALAVLAVIFVSPLCALSSALFSARTVHHVLLVAVVAPLLAWSLPRAPTRGLAGATVVQALVLWAWHAPAAYGWALSNDVVYWLMQASLLGSAVWFWSAIRGASPLPAAGGLLVAMVAMGLVGAVLTFAERALYAPHLATTAAWGLSPLQDQQAAGLIMWVPAAAIYLLAALLAVGRGLRPAPVVPAT